MASITTCLTRSRLSLAGLILLFGAGTAPAIGSEPAAAAAPAETNTATGAVGGYAEQKVDRQTGRVGNAVDNKVDQKTDETVDKALNKVFDKLFK